MNPEACPPKAGEHLVLSGTVVSGARKAAFFTQLDWVRSQCLHHLGFEPFPGTLNLRLAEQDESSASRVLNLPGLPLLPPAEASCAGRVYPVSIGAIPGAIVVPEETVRIHDSGVLEILAPVSLREALHLEDGDRVSLAVRL